MTFFKIIILMSIITSASANAANLYVSKKNVSVGKIQFLSSEYTISSEGELKIHSPSVYVSTAGIVNQELKDLAQDIVDNGIKYDISNTDFFTLYKSGAYEQHVYSNLTVNFNLEDSKPMETSLVTFTGFLLERANILKNRVLDEGREKVLETMDTKIELRIRPYNKHVYKEDFSKNTLALDKKGHFLEVQLKNQQSRMTVEFTDLSIVKTGVLELIKSEGAVYLNEAGGERFLFTSNAKDIFALIKKNALGNKVEVVGKLENSSEEKSFKGEVSDVKTFFKASKSSSLLKRFGSKAVNKRSFISRHKANKSGVSVLEAINRAARK